MADTVWRPPERLSVGQKGYALSVPRTSKDGEAAAAAAATSTISVKDRLRLYQSKVQAQQMAAQTLQDASQKGDRETKWAIKAPEVPSNRFAGAKFAGVKAQPVTARGNAVPATPTREAENKKPASVGASSSPRGATSVVAKTPEGGPTSVTAKHSEVDNPPSKKGSVKRQRSDAVEYSDVKGNLVSKQSMVKKGSLYEQGKQAIEQRYSQQQRTSRLSSRNSDQGDVSDGEGNIRQSQWDKGSVYDPWADFDLYEDMVRKTVYEQEGGNNLKLPARPYEQVRSKDGEKADNQMAEIMKMMEMDNQTKKGAADDWMNDLDDDYEW